jgi:hypothetical protein
MSVELLGVCASDVAPLVVWTEMCSLRRVGGGAVYGVEELA